MQQIIVFRAALYYTSSTMLEGLGLDHLARMSFFSIYIIVQSYPNSDSSSLLQDPQCYQQVPRQTLGTAPRDKNRNKPGRYHKA
jgi:hypothetical protein